MTTEAGKRILIVDDDPGIRRVLQVLLTKSGYQVTQASDGFEALRLWREHGGDLVITDLHMPEKNGIETILELLTHSPGMRIIAMSGGGQTKRLDLLGILDLLETTRHAMSTPQVRLNSALHWGLGWGIQRDEQGEVLWHWGANNSFRNFVIADPTNGRAIVVFTNSENGLRICERVIVAVTGHDHPAFLWI